MKKHLRLQIEKFQTELAQYFQKKYGLEKLTFVLTRDGCNHWNLIKEDDPKAALPPWRHHLAVNTGYFDTRILRPHDDKFIKNLAAKYNLHYGGSNVAVHRVLLFDEILSTGEAIAEGLTCVWTSHMREFTEAHKFKPADILDGVKIFLHYVAAHEASISGRKFEKAHRLAKTMLEHVDPAEIKRDTKFAAIARKAYMAGLASPA